MHDRRKEHQCSVCLKFFGRADSRDRHAIQVSRRRALRRAADARARARCTRRRRPTARTAARHDDGRLVRARRLVRRQIDGDGERHVADGAAVRAVGRRLLVHLARARASAARRSARRRET